MRFFTIVSVLISIALSHNLAAEEFAQKRVAVLISSYGEEGRENLSYDLEELAQAYLVLHDNEVAIDIISPKGGEVLVHNKKDDLPYMQRFKKHTPALEQLNATIMVSEISASNYDAVLVIGGDGAMFDLPTDPAAIKFISDIAALSKPIAAVCHGPAALVNVKNEQGDYLIGGKQVNSFTNIEEQAFGSEVINDLPFLLESKMKERGAIFVNNAPMLPFISVDGNLITGQNPSSVASAVEAMLIQLGITPRNRVAFKDEATMNLIQQARQSGAYLIDVALSKQPELYDINYLALYGFYSYGLASNEAEKKRELIIMEAVGRNFKHATYEAAFIHALVEQDQVEKARQALARFKEQYPESSSLAELSQLVNPKY
jgi:putative intracellular protease/amidase